MCEYKYLWRRFSNISVVHVYHETSLSWKTSKFERVWKIMLWHLAVVLWVADSDTSSGVNKHSLCGVLDYVYKMWHCSLKSLVLLAIIALVSSETINKDITFKKYERKIDLSSQLVKFVHKIVVETTGTSIKNFLFTLTKEEHDKISYIGAKVCDVWNKGTWIYPKFLGALW